ncbi:PREDICTED: monocarboxylate transporter 12-like, partial [Priapulus caudatus]|uniref:Monocarboxylate transporter 12-like n=1 Tax=Priapulus caudatus TaxID=37621 RepID=A0ABM1DT82_PRICU
HLCWTVIVLPLEIGPLSSRLSHKIGCRWTVILGGALSGAGYTLSYFGNSLNYLLVTYGCVSGIGCGLVYTPVVAVISHFFTRRRQFATAVAVSGAGIGNLCFPPLLQHLVDMYGWRGAMLVCGSLALNMCICGALLRPSPPHASPTNSTCDSKLVDASAEPPVENRRDDATTRLRRTATRLQRTLLGAHGAELLSDVRLLVLLLDNMLFIGSMMVVIIMLNDYVTYCGISPDDSTYILSIFGVFNMSGRLLAGVVTLHRHIDSMTTFCFSMAAMGAISMAIAPTRHYAGFAIVAAAFGSAYGMGTSAMPSALADMFGTEKLLHSFGFINFASGLGGVVAAPLAGWLYDVTKSYYVMFTFGGCLSLFGSFIMAAMLHWQHYRGCCCRPSVRDATHPSKTIVPKYCANDIVKAPAELQVILTE